MRVRNGIVGTPDGKHLYVAEAKANRILKYDILPDGLLTNRQVFANMGSDGMTIDENDHLWIAVWNAGCLLLLDPQRGRFELFPMPVSKVTCPTFGGPDNDELYVTSAAYMTDLAKWPEAGNTFGCKFGVRGRAPFRFKMMK